MTVGIETTLTALAKSRNRAARHLLFELVFRNDDSLRDRALELFLPRAAIPDLLRLLASADDLSPRQQERLEQEGSRLSPALRSAFLSDDPVLFRQGIRWIEQLADIDQTPLLFQALYRDTPRRSVAAELLSRLAERYFHGPPPPTPVPPQAQRRFVQRLRDAVQRMTRHQQPEVVRAFLLATDDTTAITWLADPAHPAARAFRDTLRNSNQPRLWRWLWLLFQQGPVPADFDAIVRECADLPFIAFWLDQMEEVLEQLPSTPRFDLGPLHSLWKEPAAVWLTPGHESFRDLDTRRQIVFGQWAFASGLPIESLIDLLAWMLDAGRPATRAWAIVSLAPIPGPEASALILAGSFDEDPEVRAASLQHAAQRGVADVLPQLLDAQDEEAEKVRATARDTFHELTLDELVAMARQVDVDTRRRAGLLYTKMVPAVLTELRDRLASPDREQKFDAACVVRDLALADQLAPNLYPLLRDDDPVMNGVAVAALRETDNVTIPHQLIQGIHQDGGSFRANVLRLLEYWRRDGRTNALRQTASQWHDYLLG